MDQREHRTDEHGRSILWLAGFMLAMILVAFVFVTVENRMQVATNYTPIVDEVRVIPPVTQPAPLAPSPLEPRQSQ
jgi:hypothetical protein